ncbi:MAG: glycosyltransferase [Rhodospirillaceae bacterium]|nr:glycosyltransferase [Rhodospirillaceae bacterium]
MRVLFVGDLDPNGNAHGHLRALERVGCEVQGLDPSPFLARGGRISGWLRHRLMMGGAVDALNDAILEAASTFKPDMIWGEKPVAIQPKTLRKLCSAGVLLVSHNVDNPFGDMREPIWRLFRKTIPLYDAHVTPRRSSMLDFPKAGAAQMILMELAFDPERQFPPPDGWSDRDRDLAVSFTGSPYDDRAQLVTELLRDHGIRVDIRGNRWERMLDQKTYTDLVSGGPVFGDDYRQRIWQSRICLAFVTHANHDETAIRSFEITACQGLLLSEYTDRLAELFEPDKEAVFFASAEECAAKIRWLLDDEEARDRISQAGRVRAVESGYDNTARFTKMLGELRSRFPGRLPG